MLSDRMSSAAKKIFVSARLPGFMGRGDRYLGDIAQDLRRVLWKTQNAFTQPTCRLPDAAWSDVAVLLVEWGEDIHNDLGLWRVVEAHQRRHFGTSLPFVHVASADELQGFDPRRIQYFLWNLWPAFNAELLLSPTHPDLKRLAEVAGQFLTKRMAGVPRDSGLKRFLSTPNVYGWDIKSKLYWMGINSYLFRWLFLKYLDDGYQREPDISTKDDFICQHCTEWAGLGVIDVLAGVLDLPERDRDTLRTWHERHSSVYRIIERHEEGDEVKTLTALNIVNGELYIIRMNMPDCPFTTGLVVNGALTPWRGEWYWSGQQDPLGNLREECDAQIRKKMLEGARTIAYRYCPAEAARAREMTRTIHAKFVAHHGRDLVAFPDGLTLAAAEQKRIEADWGTINSEAVAKRKEQDSPDEPCLRLNLPAELLKHDQGVGAFANPEEGVELMLYFNHVLSGLRKRGSGLNEDELSAVNNLLTNTSVSPDFVRRLAMEHGAESIAAAFLIEDSPPELVLEFLLRRHKGQYFRTRYESPSVPQPVKWTNQNQL